MGDLIQFPVKYQEPVDPEMARLRRIQEALRKINELMKRLRDDNQDLP